MECSIIKKSTIVGLLAIMLALMCWTGCTKLLDVPAPDNKTIGKEIFNNKDSATAAVAGIYTGLSSTTNLLSGAISVYTGLYCDELSYNAQQTQIQEFYSAELSPANTTIEYYFWGGAYKHIYSANACIEGLEASTTLPEQLKNQLIGECKVLRSLMYFHLIRCFGDVPLVKVTSYLQNEQMPRTPVHIVEEFIEADLLKAKELLGTAYPSPDRARANKWVAAALLAQYYQYKGNWQAAEQEATAVINAGYYSMEEIGEVFLATSSEAIFLLQPVLNGYNTMEGNWLVPAGAMRPPITLSPTLLAAFETGDIRMKEWVGYKTVNGYVYSYPFKYKKRADFSTSFKLTEYTTLLRLSEMYLLRAEAKVALGQLADAMTDLDLIRGRAGLPLIKEHSPSISAEELKEKILHERRIELYAECGHRWYDLKRTGKVNQTMSAVKTKWQSTDTLWPVPATQIFLNPVLTQNEGYK
ncbi:RagB/SusD family nutrient uptake outer membrane protein [Chitinophaga rhizophila]|uniref:RagB/SusD family nutrient uptake outer membrane protein n=1 Tax=Chitinophaga rhizophila TaxID=2866212 RepID=A0ABS7GGH6_9BACT|nr:RagB/SusD family nutrient uptake outer membrane protein [Chitinophaga rhizophila]MBW8686797.1 RagB/SusD family nutrient uptake outer membrane protein [Chitinophaga rhizophila]